MAEGTAVNALGDFTPGLDIGSYGDAGGGSCEINLATGVITSGGKVVGVVSLSALMSKTGTLSIDLKTGLISHNMGPETAVVGGVGRKAGFMMTAEGTVTQADGFVADVTWEANRQADWANVDPVTGAHPNGWAYRKLDGPWWLWTQDYFRVGGAEGTGAG